MSCLRRSSIVVLVAAASCGAATSARAAGAPVGLCVGGAMCDARVDTDEPGLAEGGGAAGDHPAGGGGGAAALHEGAGRADRAADRVFVDRGCDALGGPEGTRPTLPPPRHSPPELLRREARP